MQLVRQRVDVGEAGEVADDRRHARPPAAARRQDRPHLVGAAHLSGHLARQLEHVAVQQEEARQVEVADHAQLLVEARLRLLTRLPAGVALAHAARSTTSASLRSASGSSEPG